MSEYSLEKRILLKLTERLDIRDVDADTYDYGSPVFLSDETGEEPQGLGLDSIDALELVVALHDEFGIKVELENMKDLRTIRDIADFVRKECADEK